MNTNDNTRLDATILNSTNAHPVPPVPPVPPTPQPEGAPVPPPIPAPEAFGSTNDSFGTAPMKSAPVNFSSQEFYTSEPINMESSSPAGTKRKNAAIAAMAAGIGGAALGAGVMMFTGFAKPEEEPKGETKPEDKADNLADQLTDGEIPVAHNVTDDMSFAEAFAAARSEVGPGGAFTWHGQVYSTYTEQEWNAMSTQEQHAFNDHFAFNTGGDTHTNTHTQQHTAHHSDNPHHTTPSNNHGGEKPTTPETPNYPYTVNVNGENIEVLGMEQVNGHTVATVRIDGKIALMVDEDNDGNFDYLAADLNDDGELDPEQEIVDLRANNISINVAQLSQNGEQPGDETPVTPPVNNDPQAIVVHNDETGQNIAAMQTDDGKVVYLIDDDGDQKFDYAWLDVNGNGSPEPDEVMDLQAAGKTITVNDLGGFTSEEQLAQMQQAADEEVLVAEVDQNDDLDRSDVEEVDDDDMVIVDPDDTTMPGVTDDDSADDIMADDVVATDDINYDIAIDDTADDTMDM